MKTGWAWMVLAGALALACEGGAGGSDATGPDATSPDVVADTAPDVTPDTANDVTPPLDTVPDAPGDLAADTPADVPADTPADLPRDLPPDAPADVSPDAPADVPFDGVVPPGCCATDDDCLTLASPVALVCAHAGWGEPAQGVCKPVADEGGCWRDGDCPGGQICHGAAVCPCDVDCDMRYEGPGRCLDAVSACTKIDPSWVLEWCDAASLVIWDGTQCVATCPGCCECGPFCDLVFQSLAECEAACHKEPCDARDELQPFQLWAVFPNDDGGFGGGDTLTVADDATIEYVGAPEPDVGTDGKQVTFRLADDTLFKVLIQLPAGLALPFGEGQEVHVYAKRFWPWWADLAVVVWPTYGGWPLLFVQAAAQPEAWFDCDGLSYCPSATFLPTDCAPFEMTCGQGVQPPVQVLATGQPTEAETGAVLQQGELADGYPGYTYGVARAYELTDYQCADYPSPWNASFLVRTYQAFKLAFDQDNTPQYEFYELCVPKDSAEAVSAVQALDPSLYCGLAGAFAGCDATENGCHGDLAFEAGTKTLTPAKWTQIKALSLLDVVSRIGGGYWL